VPALKKAILSVLGGKMAAQARVEAVERVSEHFRLIDILSAGLKNWAWQPGAKLQLDTGGWEMRTYTPISIDAAAERVRILAFGHGRGPASKWAMSVKAGDGTHIVGPRPSLDLADPNGAATFFGDETSFAAAKTLQAHLGSGVRSRYVFEVNSREESQAVVERLELNDATLVEIRSDRSHLNDVVEMLQIAITATATRRLVLTGSGLSIQSIRTALRTAGLSDIQFQVAAYWAPNKVGLH
jgi:NADPH-dependent ferric siderophore reductase